MPDGVEASIVMVAAEKHPLYNRVALPRYLRNHDALRRGAQIVPGLAGVAMLLALVGNFYPVPEGPYGKLPYIYLAYLAAGLLWFVFRGRRKDPALTEN